MILNRIHWSLLTFSWSSSSLFSLLFGWFLLSDSSSSGSWLLFSCTSSSSWLFSLLLSWFSLIFSNSSLIVLLSSFLLFWNSNFKICCDLVEEIFSESAFQHLWGFIINAYFFDLDFRLFWDPIESSFSLFLLNFKRNSFNRTSLNSFN